jgi:glucose-1-phosphate thymidylyltransferase
VVTTGETIAAAVLPPGTLQTAAGLSADGVVAYLASLRLEPLPATLPLFQYPHDVLRHHLSILAKNLEDRLANGDYREIADGVFAAPEAKLGEHVVTDTSSGLILLDVGATIGPHSLLQGPLYVGPHARVLEHAAIKDYVVLGHTTKIGGEVEASVIEPYTNKQHHGFLGHSYLGSWINLGAGTCNSDLKNTYGPVNMDYGGKRVSTDMQFVGVIMGDYSKSAINTGIFTGKTVGVCSMVYGFVTTNVPSFVNYARLFGQVTAAPVEVMVSTQARMFARRGVTQRPCDIQLVHDMFELTRHERELGSVPLEPLSL